MNQAAKRALQFAIQLRNYSSGPIKYTFEVFDIRLGSRSLPKVGRGALFGFMPRGGGRVSSQVPFKQKEVQEFIGETVTGTADIEISYGHPELPPVRKLKMSLNMILRLENGTPPVVRFNHNILEETDREIT